MCFKFELAYWADIINPEPLNPDVNDKNNSLFIENPYLPASENTKPPSKKFRKKVLDFIEKEMDKLFLNKDRSINFTAITDLIIKHYFKDFDVYYSSSCVNQNKMNVLAKDVIRSRLADLIRKHRGKEILLLSHSMGTIISYE